ncbi:hypothetical protein GE061_019832 [Apolygus lucorum]|uniref:Uncharacterized protein n=1 Tax=Apolygus lucorum TaxID=248454 RepID=A0A6A4JYA2_APOLU|nr:hypothetical protein GE061_019832 [Apolygus lucorum]
MKVAIEWLKMFLGFFFAVSMVLAMAQVAHIYAYQFVYPQYFYPQYNYPQYGIGFPSYFGWNQQIPAGPPNFRLSH